MNKMSKIIPLFLVTLTIFSGCGKKSNLQDEVAENFQVEDLTSLAAYDYATEQQLIVAAKQCATIRYYVGNADSVISIATSICENPNTTGKIIKELASSAWPEVLIMAAQSEHADEEALIAIAKRCATIARTMDNENKAIAIATSICENPNTTGKVIKELAPSAWSQVLIMAAQSEHADEEALIAIAKHCATIQPYGNNETDAITIATSICENQATTRPVLKELTNSSFTSVTSLAQAKLVEIQ